MFRLSLTNFVRQIKGRPFHSTRLEREFVRVYQLAAVRLTYVYAWIAATSFAVFSLTEFLVYGRNMTDEVQLIRGVVVIALVAIGFYLRSATDFIVKQYVNLVSFIILLIDVSACFLEYKSQIKGEPGFFYLSVASISIILTVTSYGFLRLPVARAIALTLVCDAVGIFTAMQSMVPNPNMISRMMTYTLTANLIGFVLHRLLEMSERRVFFKTLRLNRVAALRQKLIEAEAAANETKTRFLAMLSHEIRTPMNGILGLVGMLQRDVEMNESKAKAFDALSFSCDRLLRTFNDLLDYAKLGHSDAITMLKPSFFNLEQMMEEASKIFNYAAQQKNIALVTDFTQVERATLLGDHSKLSRVVVNLISNAIKFTSQGWVSVKASSKRLSNDVAHIRIEVSDSGIGIPREHLTKVFQAFYQVDSSNARKYEGSGLGLAICKQIITAMSGTITVSSELGSGTQFVIDLKLPIAHAALHQPQAIAANSGP